MLARHDSTDTDSVCSNNHCQIEPNIGEPYNEAHVMGNKGRTNQRAAEEHSNHELPYMEKSQLLVAK